MCSIRGRGTGGLALHSSCGSNRLVQIAPDGRVQVLMTMVQVIQEREAQYFPFHITNRKYVFKNFYHYSYKFDVYKGEIKNLCETLISLNQKNEQADGIPTKKF